MLSLRPTGLHSARERWQRLAMHIRLALLPDDPRLLSAYLTQGQDLIATHGQPPWSVHRRSLTLLLDAASDALLPIAWRMTCLDTCCRPLGQLGALVDSDAHAIELRSLAWRLARFSLHPTHDEP